MVNTSIFYSLKLLELSPRKIEVSVRKNSNLIKDYYEFKAGNL